VILNVVAIFADQWSSSDL